MICQRRRYEKQGGSSLRQLVDSGPSEVEISRRLGRLQGARPGVSSPNRDG